MANENVPFWMQNYRTHIDNLGADVVATDGAECEAFKNSFSSGRADVTDIVERLCKPLGGSPDWRFIGKYQVYRSDEERVEAAEEIKLLRAAIKPFADAAARFTPYAGEMEEKEVNAFFTLGQLRAAASALNIHKQTGERE